MRNSISNDLTQYYVFLSYWILPQTGDKIRVTAQVNEEWLRGELGSQSGIFPASFIDAVPPNLPPDDSSKRATSPTASTKSDTAKVHHYAQCNSIAGWMLYVPCTWFFDQTPRLLFISLVVYAATI